MSGHLNLTPSERIVAWRLAEGRCAPVTELAAALYGNRADGGANHAAVCVGIVVWRLKRKLQRFGIEVVTLPARGWCVRREHRVRLLDILAQEIDCNTPGRTRLSGPTAAEAGGVS